MTITINPQAADVITINISDADQITLNTTAIVFADGDADTLQGQDGAYYLSRTNHTGTQAISTVTGLQAALDDKLESVAWGDIGGTLSDQTDLQDALNLKLDSADYNDRFLGLYASFFDLEAAHPTASAGDYAQVDWGIGTDVIVYVYDVSDAQWIPVGSSAIANTDALPEGSSNLYFTSQRVRDTTIGALPTVSAVPIVQTDNLPTVAAKLQTQVTAQMRRNKIPAATGRYYTNCNFGVTFSASTVAAGQLRTTFFEPLTDITVDQLGVFLTAAPTAGARIKLAIYEFDPASANSLLLVHSVPEIVADATIGAKLVSTSFAFKLGRVYVITHLSDQSLAMRNFASSSSLSAGLDAVSATAPISLWVATGVTYSATAPATLDLSTFGTLTSNTSLILMRAV